MKQLLLLSYLIVKTLMLTATSAEVDLQKFVKKADSCYEILNYTYAKALYAEAISIVNKEADPYLFSYLLNQYASSLFWLDEMNEAEAACRRSLNFTTKTLGPLHPYTAEAHINLGAQKFVSGNYSIVTEHFYEAAFILENYYGKLHPKVAKAYEWLGAVYESKSDTANAKEFLWKSLNIYSRRIGADHPDVAELYRYIGLFYKRFAQLDSAIFYFEKAKNLFDQKYGEANFQSVKCMNNLSDVYGVGYNQWEKVKHSHEKCLRLIPCFQSPNKHTSAMTYYQMFNYYNHHGEYLKSIEYLNRIVKLYSADYDVTTDIPDVHIIQELSSTIPKVVLFTKARTFVNLSSVDTLNKHQHLKSASNLHKLLDQILDQISGKIVNANDRWFFSNSHAKLYFSMARLDIELFNSGFGTGYLDNALYYLEKKKISEQLRTTSFNPMIHNDIKNELLSEITQLNREINYLQSEQFHTDDRDTISRLLIQKALKADMMYYDLDNRYDHPVFAFQNKKSLSSQNIMSSLMPNESLLYYAEATQDYKFVPHTLMIIAINSDSAMTVMIDGYDLFHQIIDFNHLLSTNALVDTICKSGKALYDNLIGPVREALREKIIVCPSAYVSLTPFYALSGPEDPDNCRMLIEDHLIWKIFSLDDIMSASNDDRMIAQDSLLAVAPLFNEAKAEEIALLTKRDINLINLAGAVKECALIANHFNTFMLDGLNASKTNFKKVCSRFRYIHISTHGAPVELESNIIQLAFSPACPDESSWLNFYEVLNLDINADMVVLSACKTGIGMKNNAEGNLNLAWAFRQAGARSAIISLWDVSDYASSQIMPAFYEKLRKEVSKPEALRLAKLRYINEHDEVSAAPYFWAAFDFIGNSGDRSAVTKTTKNYTIVRSVTLFTLALFLLTVVAIWRKLRV